MKTRQLKLGIGLIGLMAGLAVAASAEPVDADWLPAAKDAAVNPGTVPIVPLPPAVYGSMASIAMLLVLRHSKHRRWVTLR